MTTASVALLVMRQLNVCIFCPLLDVAGICRWSAPAAQRSALLIERRTSGSLSETDFVLALASQGGVKTFVSLGPRHSIYTHFSSSVTPWLRMDYLITLWKAALEWAVMYLRNNHFLSSFWLCTLILLQCTGTDGWMFYSYIWLFFFTLTLRGKAGKWMNIGLIKRRKCSVPSELPLLKSITSITREHLIRKTVVIVLLMLVCLTNRQTEKGCGEFMSPQPSLPLHPFVA